MCMQGISLQSSSLLLILIYGVNTRPVSNEQKYVRAGHYGMHQLNYVIVTPFAIVLYVVTALVHCIPYSTSRGVLTGLYPHYSQTMFKPKSQKNVPANCPLRCKAA